MMKNTSTIKRIFDTYKKRTIEEMNESIKWAHERGIVQVSSSNGDGNKPIRPTPIRYVHRPIAQRLN